MLVGARTPRRGDGVTSYTMSFPKCSLCRYLSRLAPHMLDCSLMNIRRLMQADRRLLCSLVRGGAFQAVAACLRGGSSQALGPGE